MFSSGCPPVAKASADVVKVRPMWRLWRCGDEYDDASAVSRVRTKCLHHWGICNCMTRVNIINCVGD